FSCVGKVQPLGPMARAYRYFRRGFRCAGTTAVRTDPHRTYPDRTGPPVRPNNRRDHLPPLRMTDQSVDGLEALRQAPDRRVRPIRGERSAEGVIVGQV
ncbi:MAG: hypothetical protein P4L84_19060, partial [Isosphaeraceae bacterium]|nr:hypothetical protein [Isosphaeraceae bacterium]